MVDLSGADSNDNQVVDQELAGWQLAGLLLGGFRALVEQMHDELAEHGHPLARPVHGFTLQAVGEGATASQVATRLGVSKQAATKTLARLEDEGYVRRTPDRVDARRILVRPTRRGRSLLQESAAAFDAVLDRWRASVGEDHVDQLARTLLALEVSPTPRLDLGAWSG